MHRENTRTYWQFGKVAAPRAQISVLEPAHQISNPNHQQQGRKEIQGRSITGLDFLCSSRSCRHWKLLVGMMLVKVADFYFHKLETFHYNHKSDADLIEISYYLRSHLTVVTRGKNHSFTVNICTMQASHSLTTDLHVIIFNDFIAKLSCTLRQNSDTSNSASQSWVEYVLKQAFKISLWKLGPSPKGRNLNGSPWKFLMDSLKCQYFMVVHACKMLKWRKNQKPAFMQITLQASDVQGLLVKKFSSVIFSWNCLIDTGILCVCLN